MNPFKVLELDCLSHNAEVSQGSYYLQKGVPVVRVIYFDRCSEAWDPQRSSNCRSRLCYWGYPKQTDVSGRCDSQLAGSPNAQ